MHLASRGLKPGMMLMPRPSPSPITTFPALTSPVASEKPKDAQPAYQHDRNTLPSAGQGTSFLLSLRPTHRVAGLLEFPRNVRDVPERMVMLGIVIFQAHVA